MGKRPSRWLAVGLGVAVAVVLAGPVAILRPALRPVPLDAQHLRVRFESVRYERAGLVFTYLLENRTRRSARLLPQGSTLRARQREGPVVGYPVIKLPLDIEAHVSQRVEVRLELAVPGVQMTARQSADQTDRVLQHQLPGTGSIDSPLSPLPMSKLPAGPEPAQLPAEDVLLANALTSLQGFELVDEDHGIHIVFPRGW
jgi:hypothetical protein